jgi:hypothetical protein
VYNRHESLISITKAPEETQFRVEACAIFFWINISALIIGGYVLEKNINKLQNV